MWTIINAKSLSVASPDWNEHFKIGMAEIAQSLQTDCNDNWWISQNSHKDEFVCKTTVQPFCWEFNLRGEEVRRWEKGWQRKRRCKNDWRNEARVGSVTWEMIGGERMCEERWEDGVKEGELEGKKCWTWSYGGCKHAWMTDGAYRHTLGSANPPQQHTLLKMFL